MAFGSTPTTSSQGALATNQIPLGEVYVPNHAGGNATALQGGPASTDTLGNESAPVATYTPDGNDVTQGMSTDANTANTVIGRLTKIRDLLLATLVVSGNITEANSAAINTHLANIDTAIAALLVDTNDIEANTANIPVIGPQVKAASMSVTFATDIPTLTVTGGGGGTQYTDGAAPPANPIGTVPVFDNAGAWVDVGVDHPMPVLETNSAAILADTADIEASVANIPPLGQALAASSVPVVLTALQQTALTPPAAITGFALEAGNLATLVTNTADLLADGDHLATIDAKLPALGAQATANSQAVNIASDQTVPVSQKASTSVSATLQSAQAGNAVGTPLTVLGMGVAMLTVNMAGFTGTVNFEGQEDGSNFKALNAVLVGTNTITSTAIGVTATTINLYEIPIAGLSQIQARTSSVSAGTVTVTAHAVPVPYNGKVVNANQGAGAAAGTSWRIAGDYTEVAGQAAGSVTGTSTDLFPSQDVSGYKWVSIQITGTWNMTLTIQGSNDNANFINVINASLGSFTGLGTGITANGIYVAPVQFRYMRVRPTVWTSNASCVGTMELYTSPAPPQNLAAYISQNSSLTVQPGNTANTTPWLINNQQVAGTTTSVNAGTADAGTQRVTLASDQNAPVNLKQIGGVSTQMANIDGVLPSNLLAEGTYLYDSGGPVDSTGKPQQAAWGRLTSLQGKVSAGSSANITSTLQNDTNLVFSSAPKTIMPGQKVSLAVGGGNPIETVIVSSAYTPSSTATSIPLQYPVVNASSTTAKWDVFGSTGPGAAKMSAFGLLPVANGMNDINGGGTYLMNNSSSDNVARAFFLEVAMGISNNASTSTGNLDVMRGNLDNITLVASAAYTTTQTSADQTNYNGRGVIVTLDMTNIVAGPSVTLEIDMKDPVSGKYVSLLTGAAVTTVSTNVYTVYPGAPATANVSANSPLTRTWRVKVMANNANSGTYSVGASVIV